jgi:hypothetical protein
MAVTNPLDTLRCRWQVTGGSGQSFVGFIKSITRTEGIWKGFWRPGLPPNMVAMGFAIGGRNGFYPTFRDGIGTLSGGTEKVGPTGMLGWPFGVTKCICIEQHVFENSLSPWLRAWVPAHEPYPWAQRMGPDRLGHWAWPLPFDTLRRYLPLPVAIHPYLLICIDICQCSTSMLTIIYSYVLLSADIFN